MGGDAGGAGLRKTVLTANQSSVEFGEEGDFSLSVAVGLSLLPSHVFFLLIALSFSFVLGSF